MSSSRFSSLVSRDHFYQAIVEAGKLDNKKLSDEIVAVCRARFKNYRNLEHLITSAEFFGQPTVEVLHDETGAFRVIDCDTSVNSDVVFITFGKVSSHIDHIPFGYPFLTRSGFKHIHIAQHLRTSYQKLTLEDFGDLLSPIVDGYKFRITYGASLGGYAAIYYASSIGAFSIAGSPRLSIHPVNLQFKGVHWQPGSHWDEAEYEHSCLSDVLSGYDRCVFLAYDSNNEIDSKFMNTQVLPFARKCFVFNFQGAKHGAFAWLSRRSELKPFIMNIVSIVKSDFV